MKSESETLSKEKVTSKFKVDINPLRIDKKVSLPENESDFEVVGQIFSTTKYDLFKTVKGNRNVVPKHVADLVISYQKAQLVVPVIVNEKMEIIDGQHRFTACKNTNRPVYFIICHGYGEKEIQMLNSNMVNWQVDDYTKFYCDAGMEEYLQYQQFRIKFGFGHQESLAMLAGSTSNFYGIFTDGKFKIKNLEDAENVAARVKDFAPIYKGYKRKSFVFAALHIFREVKEYDHQEMLSKVAMQSTKMVDCSSTKQYLMILEDIYNFHRRGTKVRFI